MTSIGQGTDRLMTVGELARRTGLSIKAIRQYEALGLIYSAGRSESGYRSRHAAALDGRPGADLFGRDPRRDAAA